METKEISNKDSNLNGKNDLKNSYSTTSTTSKAEEKIHLKFKFKREDCLDFFLPSYLSDENSRLDPFIKTADFNKIDKLLEYFKVNNINIFLPNDYYFTVFHSLIQGFRHSDFKSAFI